MAAVITPGRTRRGETKEARDPKVARLFRFDWTATYLALSAAGAAAESAAGAAESIVAAGATVVVSAAGAASSVLAPQAAKTNSEATRAIFFMGRSLGGVVWCGGSRDIRVLRTASILFLPG